MEERGPDIKASRPFVNCNLSDFISSKRHFELVEFFTLQQVFFPHLYKLVVCLSSLRTNEVGCEQFFSQAGFVPDPRRTSLAVRNYESISMLKRNMQHVFINEEWVVNKYLEIDKSKSWNPKNTAMDTLVFNLEQEILAETMGVSVDDLEGDDSEEEETAVEEPVGDNDGDEHRDGKEDTSDEEIVDGSDVESLSSLSQSHQPSKKPVTLSMNSASDDDNDTDDDPKKKDTCSKVR